MLRVFLSKLRKEQQTGEARSEAASGVVRHRISPARASWLFMCVPDKLDEAQRQSVQNICAAHTELEAAYRLAQAFVSQLKNQAGAEAVDAWVLQAEQRGLPELKSFAKRSRCIMHLVTWINIILFQPGAVASPVEERGRTHGHCNISQ